MLIRSGKIQFLFWTFFFSAMIYLWIVAVGFQTFILPDEKPLEMPQNVIVLLFILYGFLTITTLSGLVVSVMINNRHYTKIFSGLIILIFATIMASKGIFG
jgi:fatty acid desaturase